MNDFTPKGLALITGASAGIGAVYADRLARRGHGLILVARDKARLDALAATLRAEVGVSVETLRADLNDTTELKVVEQRLLNDPDISILVNNAGAAVAGSVLEADVEAIDAMVRLNVLAPTRLAIAAGKAFGAAGRGAIINLASVLALLPERSNGAYSGTKAYILNFSQALGQELEPKGVRVQAVLPGATRTEIWSRAGIDPNAIDPAMLMDVDPMVDAALAGFDLGEAVTIPALPDVTDWHAFQAARLKMAPNLSRSQPAYRYMDTTQ